MAVEMDLITLEIVQEYLVSTVREMRVTMIRTAHSSIIYEGHDFSCALLGANGDLVAQSEDSPAHILPLPWQVREAIEFFGGDFSEGDVVIVNDPYASGTHMNDVAIIVPHFHKGELLAFVVTRAHWGDVGGMTPGSISGEASEIFQEGLRLPFLKIHEGGRPVEPLLRLIFANVRDPEEREGDFHAMLSCCITASRRLDELLERFGLDDFKTAVAALINRAERRMCLAIETIPDGTYRYEDYLDADPSTGDPVLLTVAIKVEGDRVTLDYAGSSRQVSGPTNGSLAVTAMGSFVALKALLDPEGAINQGAFRPVTVVAPKGTIVNVEPPGAVGGYTEIRRRVESVVMGALARAVPKYAAGDIKGASNHSYIGSFNAARGKSTIFYEYPAGGTGACLEHDGNNTLRAYDEGDFASIQPAEAVEIEHALLVEDCSLRVNSGGDGRNRGGLGMHREIRLLADSGTFSELSDRNLIPPFGVCHGHAAAPNEFYVRRGGERIAPSKIPGKVSGFPLKKDDIVVFESAGGGGYGPPLDRDPAKVAEDVRQGFVTKEKALAVYGVVLRDGVVDVDATARRREELSGQMFLLSIAECENVFDGGRRISYVAPANLERLGGDGTLVEIVSGTGAPLRTWLRSDPELEQGTVKLGSTALGILSVSVSDRVEVRTLRPGAI